MGRTFLARNFSQGVWHTHILTQNLVCAMRRSVLLLWRFFSCAYNPRPPMGTRGLEEVPRSVSSASSGLERVSRVVSVRAVTARWARGKPAAPRKGQNEAAGKLVAPFVAWMLAGLQCSFADGGRWLDWAIVGRAAACPTRCGALFHKNPVWNS